MWIYKYRNWPKFTWDTETVAPKLSDIRYKQGLLLGKMEAMGFDLSQEASLKTLTNDVVKSSAIEGETLNPEEVRSSIAQHLGINIAGIIPASRDVDGIVEMMLDATQRYNTPLTKERLFGWQASLFPTGRSGMHKISVGSWRTDVSGPMQVVSGPIGHEKIHFEAPAASKIDKEMTSFLEWFENEKAIDPVLKAGISHLWFVTIHPFEDGNGRIGRAIIDMGLARAEGTSERFYSLSMQIASERKEYYWQLEKQQRSNPDITEWLNWFLDCMKRAIINAEKTLSQVIYKSELWQNINQYHSINERQKIIINLMLEENFQGHINTAKYAKLTKCSTDTALRDIQDLKAKEILVQNQNRGRSTSYKLQKIKK